MAIFLEHLMNMSFMASIQGLTEALTALFHEHSSYLFWPTQYLAVYSNGSCFTLKPFLANWAASHQCTSKQHYYATSYIHSHACIHHIYITTHFFLHTSSTLLGRSAGPDRSRLLQLVPGRQSQKCEKTMLMNWNLCILHKVSDVHVFKKRIQFWFGGVIYIHTQGPFHFVSNTCKYSSILNATCENVIVFRIVRLSL